MPAPQLNSSSRSTLSTLFSQRDSSSFLWLLCLFCFASVLIQGTPRLAILLLEVIGSGVGNAREDGENILVLAWETFRFTSLHVGHRASCQRQLSPIHNCTDPELCVIQNLSKTTAGPLVMFSFFHPCRTIHYCTVS